MTTLAQNQAKYVAMTKEYQATKDDMVFSDLFAEVSEMAEKLAHREWYKTNISLHTPVGDYISCAYDGVMKAINTYSAEQGSKFTAYVKQHVLWAINDGIYKKAETKSALLNSYASVYSLDRPTSPTGEDAFSNNGDRFAYDYNSTDIDHVFNSAFENLEADMFTEIQELVNYFSEESSQDDSSFIKVIFSAIVTAEKPSAKEVNKAIAAAMPEVKPATLRKRKSRAIAKFTAYAKENGFVAIDLSQF